MNRKKSNSLQLSGSFLFSSFQNQVARQHPYRATQMWHRSIEIFLSGIPLGPHRAKARFWKVYDSSFSGHEAVVWFTDKLCVEFDPGITKVQTKLLLNKFFKAGVFKLADDEQTDKDNDEFREGHIYRLTTERKAEKTNTPKLKKNYSIEIKPLTNEQIEAIYFNKLKEKLTSLLDDVTPFISATPNPKSNLTQSNANVLPTWLLSAMKCLIDYPKRCESHCEYPNFIHDVFKLIVDYFQSNCTRVGVLIENTPFLKSIFLKLNNFNTVSENNSKHKYEERFPFPKSEFEEIDRIFTPTKNSNQGDLQPSRFVFGRRRQLDYSIDHDQNHNHSIASFSTSTDCIEPMGIYDSNRYKTGVYFETGFVNNNSPITRVVSQRDLRCYENPSLSLSPADLINHPKYSSIRGRIRSKSHADLLGDVQQPPPLIIKNTNLIQSVALFLLTIDPIKRRHLEVLLRFMGKISKNALLCLDVAMRNEDIMLNTFAPLISHDITAVKFLVENIESLFAGEFVDDFKSELEKYVTSLQIKKVPIQENKENSANYCSKISMVEYEDQRLLGETAKSLRELLDAICSVKDEKIRRKQMRKFEKEYPHIYAEKFNSMNTTQLQQSVHNNSSTTKRTPFGVLI